MTIEKMTAKAMLWDIVQRTRAIERHKKAIEENCNVLSRIHKKSPIEMGKMQFVDGASVVVYGAMFPGGPCLVDIEHDPMPFGEVESQNG